MGAPTVHDDRKEAEKDVIVDCRNSNGVCIREKWSVYPCVLTLYFLLEKYILCRVRSLHVVQHWCALSFTLELPLKLALDVICSKHQLRYVADDGIQCAS